jgi:hypothetical protein
LSFPDVKIIKEQVDTVAVPVEIHDTVIHIDSIGEITLPLCAADSESVRPAVFLIFVRRLRNQAAPGGMGDGMNAEPLEITVIITSVLTNF